MAFFQQNRELHDFVDLDFARRLEMAETIAPECVQALREYDHKAPIASAEIAGGTAFFGGPEYPANQIVSLGLHGEVTAELFEQVEEFYRSRQVPCTVVVSPLADPSLLKLLAKGQYRIAEFNSVLIRPIADKEPFRCPAGIEIEPVTPETVAWWKQAIARGFSEHGPVSDEVFGGFAALPGSLAFLARIDGQIVGGSCGRVIPEARIAALYGAATLPEFRGRGVQGALIARRLQESARAGCEYAVVSTQPGSGSQRNMQRRGFRVAYTKLVMVREWPETVALGAQDGY